jgi:hypothetical protein
MYTDRKIYRVLTNKFLHPNRDYNMGTAFNMKKKSAQESNLD